MANRPNREGPGKPLALRRCGVGFRPALGPNAKPAGARLSSNFYSDRAEGKPTRTSSGHGIVRALAELQLIFSSRSRYKKSDELASVNLLVGHFPDEFAQIGCPPPTGEIPSSSCGIARDSVEAFVTDRYIVEKLRLPNERNERIQLKIQEAQRVAGQLIGVGDNAGPLRGILAGRTNEVIADGTWDETGVNQNRRVGISVVGYVGNAPMVPKCLLNRIRQQFW